MTKMEMFAMIAAVNSDNTEIVEFCNKEMSLLESRRNRAKTPTKKQKENEEIKALILKALSESDESLTVSDLIKKEELSDFSSQKVSALLRQMIEAGSVVKIMDKKKALFSVA